MNVPRQLSQFLAAGAVALAALSSAAQTSPSPQNPKKPSQTSPAPTAPVPNAPVSTHFPILLLAFGNARGWNVHIGPKGPELLERQGYPPIVLDPGEIAREGTADIWTYRAKDTATGAEVVVHLTRESCSDTSSTTKNPFRAVVNHSQIGTLEGCARIAAELFPRLPNQSAQADDDDDTDKKKPPALPPITNSKAPVAIAFLTPAGKVMVSRGGIKKIVATSGSELALSHDGKRLLYVRSDPKPSTLNAIVLYDFETGRGRDLFHGMVSEPFWSPDDARIAYRNAVDQKSQVWSATPDAPEKALPFSAQNVDAVHGWADLHTVLASDAQNLYWLSEDKPVQTLALQEIYGDAWAIGGSDPLRLNPANSDLLLVSAGFRSAPGAASGFFLYELRSKRRVALSPADQPARHGEWSRDGLQVFYTRLSPTASVIFRIFWDGTLPRRYADGSDLVTGP